MLPKEVTASHIPQGSSHSSLEITGGSDRIIKGEVSKYEMEAKMVTKKACQPSLEKGSDWIRGTALQDLGNRLFRGWIH